MSGAEPAAIATRIEEPGLDGEFAHAANRATARGVLALGGSDGGVPSYWSRLLVPEGFACLALAYFNTPATQPALVEVPLERIERGLRWLIANPNVETPDGRVAVIGVSKGGELALLAAATFPQLVGPVVAYTPSSVVWSGIDFRNQGGAQRSSWSFRGAPLPFVPYPSGVAPARSERGLSVLPMYDRGLDGVAQDDPAVIPIERAEGPLLLVSGGDDRMWPATRMCRRVVDRLQRTGRAKSVRHLDYPEAGHALFPFEPQVAAPPLPFDLGGSTAAAAAAHAAAWPEVLRTLRA